MSQYDAIPPHMMRAMQHYVETGVVSSDFLKAVISNNLKRCVGHADDHNKTILHLYVMWFYNRAPMTCWGSEERMQEWHRGKQVEAQRRQASDTLPDNYEVG